MTLFYAGSGYTTERNGSFNLNGPKSSVWTPRVWGPAARARRAQKKEWHLSGTAKSLKQWIADQARRPGAVN